MEGWVKLHRRLLKHWVWKNEKYLKAWIYCLFRANHTMNKILIGSHLEIMERGQFITSIGNFSKDTGLTDQGVRTFWKLLEADEMISRKSTSNSTKITICNYDAYQIVQQTNNKPVTNEQQTSNKPVTTDKNVKKDKELKENKEIPEFIEFKDYALNKKRDVNIEALRLKYDSWVENGWKDGNDKQIKNWKSKLLNTIPHLPEKTQSVGTNLNAGQNRLYVPPDISETAITREQYLANKDK